MRRTILTSLLLSLAFLGAGCLGLGNDQQLQLQPVTLEYWRYDDPTESVQPIIDSYRETHPNVKVEVRTFRSEDYEHELLVALAERRGPDIFSLPNTWLSGWRSKLLPLPETTTVPSLVTDPQTGQTVAAALPKKSITLREIDDAFVEAVPDDIILDTIPQTRDERPTEAVWGLPLSLDTLAIFYNTDLLRQAGLERAPRTWKELQDQVKILTAEDNNQISQSGAAIGLARNVRHSTELLNSIMVQNGAQMIDSRGLARFNAYTVESRGQPYPPGIQSLLFYQSFARPNMSTYTWNDEQPDSMDAFIGGQTALYFGFPQDRNEIRERAPRLNFDVAPLPQIDPTRTRNLAHYPVEVVSRVTERPDLAWDFIQFATQPEQALAFLASTGRPTALRELIEAQLTDPDAAPFVGQVLTAESWYRGDDWNIVDRTFSTMIETYPEQIGADYDDVIQTAVRAVNDTIY